MKISLKQIAVSFVTPQPARDWFVALVLSIVLFIGFIAYAAYLFIGIQSGTIVGTALSQEVTRPAVGKNDLKTILDVYLPRKVNYDAGNYPRPTLVDPSK